MTQYLSVTEYAQLHGKPARTIRNYCATGKLPGAFLTGCTWSIPADTPLPSKGKPKREAMPLLQALREQKAVGLKGGIYHKVQVELTYNSNHIEGCRLSHDQTRLIFETNTLTDTRNAVNVDDVIETANHFRCIDMIIDRAEERLSEALVKELHLALKIGTSDSRLAWFAVGDYKKIPNEVGGLETTPPEEVHRAMQSLLKDYHQKREKKLDDILDFHCRFERIHPFQDGNGRIGRLIIFKECLAHHIIPFVIDERHKMLYYRGLQEWGHINGYLRDTCLSAQDNFRAILDYFRL